MVEVEEAEEVVEEAVEGMKISVKLPEGKILHLNVEDSDTIDNIKTKIFEMEGIAIKRQVLNFASKPLKSGNKTIKEYEIPNRSLLVLVQK